MGCYNRTGFFSHLPITAGEDIVMFLCADVSRAFNNNRKDSCPISIVGGGITPLAAPFFGKYDDYGGIEDVVEDANYTYFKKRYGLTLEDLCNLVHDHDGMTISDLEEIINIKKNPKDEDHDSYGLEDDEMALEILKKLINFEIEEPKIRSTEIGGDIAEDINRMEKYFYERKLRIKNNSSIVLLLEHRSVYDKMVEVGKEHYFDYWYSGEEKITPEQAFDNTVKLCKFIQDNDNKHDFDGLNPLVFGIEIPIKIRRFLRNIDVHDGDKLIDLEALVDMRERKLFASKACIHDSFTSEEIDHIIYNGMLADEIEPLKEIACNYIYFLNTFKRSNNIFAVSPYHSQTVSYKQMLPVFEEFVNILKKNIENEEELEKEIL